MFVRMTYAEHPAVSGTAPDRTPDLVGQRLIRCLLVGLREGAGDSAIRAVAPGGRQKRSNRLFEASRQEVFESLEWNSSSLGHVHGILQPIAVQGVQEHRRANALIKILRVPPEAFQNAAGFEDVGRGES